MVAEERFLLSVTKFNSTFQSGGGVEQGFPEFGLICVLKDISQFVRGIIKSADLAFEVNKAGSVVKRRLGTQLLKFIKVDVSEIEFREELCRFEPYIDLAMRHIFKSELYRMPPVHLRGLRGGDAERFVNAFNKCVEGIRSEAGSKEFQARLNRYQRSGNKNKKELDRYVDALFDRYSRLLVLRVDLSYRKEYSDISLERAVSDRVRLFENARANRLFAEMVGFIWKLEHGQDKGFHFHVMFFYDGSKVRQDWSIVQQIGRYWSEVVTKGKGMYFNCNVDKWRYKRCGIGMIAHDDCQLRGGLRDAVTYLTKADLYMQLKTTRRGMGKGHFPGVKDVRGRPRKAALVSSVNLSL